MQYTKIIDQRVCIGVGNTDEELQWLIRKSSAVYNFASTVEKFCNMKQNVITIGARLSPEVIFTWCLIHGLVWSMVMKATALLFCII